MTLTNERLDVAGGQRGYLLAVPAGQPRAVALSLHGTRSRAREQAGYSRLGVQGTAAGVVVAFPEAISPVGRGYEWEPATDMPYLSKLVDQLVERFPTADGRVAMTGMSGGARMSCHFASHRSDVVTMVGAVAGLRAPTTALSRPVPIMAFHGTADRINPYPGSGTTRWNESVPDAASRWAAANDVGPQGVTTQVSRHVSKTTYGVAGSPGETALWTIDGGGHTWPGSSFGLMGWLLLGKSTQEIDATDLILGSSHLA
jgi:polyhydroxybutyrate depolymerase